MIEKVIRALNSISLKSRDYNSVYIWRMTARYGIFGNLINNILGPKYNPFDYLLKYFHNEKWYTEKENKIPELTNLLQQATKSIKIFSSDLGYDGFYDNFEHEEVLNSLDCILTKGASVDMIFYKANHKNLAIGELTRNNPNLVKLKHRYDDNLHLYWQQETEKVSYIVVDEKHICLESPPLKFLDREAMFKYNCELLAKKWSEKFNEALKNCQEIKKDELSILS